MEKCNEIKYKGIVVGELMSDDSIKLLDTPEANHVKKLMLQSSPIDISSRRIGEIDNNGIICNVKTIEHNIIDNENKRNY